MHNSMRVLIAVAALMALSTGASAFTFAHTVTEKTEVFSNWSCIDTVLHEFEDAPIDGGRYVCDGAKDQVKWEPNGEVWSVDPITVSVEPLTKATFTSDTFFTWESTDQFTCGGADWPAGQATADQTKHGVRIDFEELPYSTYSSDAIFL